MAIVLDDGQLSTRWLEGTHRRRLAVFTALVIVASLGLARLVLAFDLVAVAGIFVLLALLAVVFQPRYGLYMLVAVVLIFEDGGGDPLMIPDLYLSKSLQSTLNISGAILTPIEMLLLLTLVMWLAHAAIRQRLDFRAGAFGVPVLLFGLTLLFGVVRGLMAGAVFNYVFWESRFLISMLLSYVLAANLIRTRGNVRSLLTLVFVCEGLAAVDGVWRKFALANTGALGPVRELWYAHDDIVMWSMLIMLVLAQQVFGAPRWQRVLGPLVLLLTCVALLVSERRAGYIAVAVAFVVFGLMLLMAKRKAFLVVIAPVLLAGVVYLPLFWNSTGSVAQPARAVRSLSAPDPRDAASNAWRDLEAINVRATIASDPLFGIGFGRPFLQIVAVPSISFFEFWDYEAHHDILWIWMKTGAFGFIAFFAVITSGIARSVWLVRTAKHAEFRVLAVVAMTAVVTSVVFCYVDLGLTGSRIPLILGVSLGTLGVLSRFQKQEVA